MEKEKNKLDGRIGGKDKDSSNGRRRSELSGGNGISESVECRESLDLKKRIIIKNDGRYLIYYDF